MVRAAVTACSWAKKMPRQTYLWTSNHRLQGASFTSPACIHCRNGWHVPTTRRGLRPWQAQRTHPRSARMCRCPPDCTCNTSILQSGSAPPIRHVPHRLCFIIAGNRACLCTLGTLLWIQQHEQLCGPLEQVVLALHPCILAHSAALHRRSIGGRAARMLEMCLAQHL